MRFFDWLFKKNAQERKEKVQSGTAKANMPTCIDPSVNIPSEVLDHLKSDMGFCSSELIDLVPDIKTRCRYLLSAVLNKNPRVRSNAISLLGETVNNEYYDVIKYLLDDKDVLVRRNAIGALEGYKNEEVLELLGKFCDDRDECIRKNVVYVLDKWDCPKAISMLRKLAKDRDGEVAAQAKDALVLKKDTKPMGSSKLAKVARSKNADKILDVLINADEISSVVLSMSLGLNDNFSCGQGLLLHERTSSSKVVTDAHKITGGGLVGSFRCNICDFSTNFGKEYFEQRIEQGSLGNPLNDHPGTEKAKELIAELKKQPTPNKHWMTQFD